jgi:intracellular multiplication protein IcmJ
VSAREAVKLLIGVIRNAAYYRANDAQRGRFDAEFQARRPAALTAGKYRCAFCGWLSRKNNEVHHLDGNHANNELSNFAVVDGLCHAYHHLGQRAASERFAADNLAEKTRLAAIPELSAQDLNLLQRAIGAALLDEREAPVAKQMVHHLAARCKPVADAFGTYMPGDFAAGMVKLDDESYQHRENVVGMLRLLFSGDLLQHHGRKFNEDFPALPVGTWEEVAANAYPQSSAAAPAG